MCPVKCGFTKGSNYERHFTEKVGVKQTTSTLGEKSGLTTETKLVEKQVEVELKTSKDDQKGSQKDFKKNEAAADYLQEDTKSQKVASDKTKASKNERITKDMSLSPSLSPPQSRSR